MISVGQLQNTFEQFMRYRKSTDFWELVAPPASLTIANWQTPPNPQWIVKTMNLLYDILEFAPNTKLQATKFTKLCIICSSTRACTSTTSSRWQMP